MQVSGGDLVDGQIQIVNRTGSQSQTYDQAGDVIRTLTTDGTQVLTQTSTWDSRGELIGDTLAGGETETRRYDADGRVTVVDTYYALNTTMYVDPPDDDGPANSPMNIGGWLESATLTSYDPDGRVMTSTNYGRQHEDWDADWPTRFSHQQADPGSTGYGLLTEHSQVTYGSSGYDNEGNAIGYSYAAENSYGQWYTTTYTVSYLRKDGYLEKATHGTSNQPNVLATTDTSIYDAFGRRIAIDTQTATLTTDPVRVFAYDANGEILERRDGSAANDTSFSVTDNGGYAVHHYAYVNGQQIGDVDEAGTIDVLSGVTGFSNTDQGTSDYVVQDGDTLQSIAQTVYGDANLWYVVADANGLQSSDDLAAGQTLKLPEVTTNSNTSTTFKPYNPRQISGSTTPSLPQAPQPAPSAHGCSGLAVVIVAVVAAFVAPEIEPYLAAAFSGTTVAAVTAGTALVSEATTVAAWFVSGVAANTAGQLASDAVGASNGYSFKEALVAGAGAAVAGGLTAEMENTPGGIWATSSTHLSPEGAAVVGAADYASTAAAEKLVGLPSQFSWAGLVAAGVSAGATNAAGLSTAQSSTLGAGGTFGQSFAGGLVQGTLNREISQGLGDDRVESWGQIAEDAFGNALGNAAIAGIEHLNEAEAEKQAPQTQGPNPAAPAAGASILPLPNGDTVDANGNVYEGGTLVGHLGPVPGEDFQLGAFKYGDRTALVDLLSGMSPGSDFDADSYDPILAPDSETLPWTQASAGFDLESSGFNPAVGSYGDTGTSLFTMFNSGSTTIYNTPMFNPTAAPDIALPYGINNDEINAEIARSPAVVAELSEAEANGVKVELTMGADYDAKVGVIEIPASEANDPSAIVQILAHELGHVMWGDVTIPQDQPLTTSQQQQFASQQLSAQLQNEGVATINNIAVAEQIWSEDPNVIADHVEGAVIPVAHVDPVANFATEYNLFDESSSMGTLQQAASDIGVFYGQYEHPANDPNETYAQYYMPSDLLNAAYTAVQAAQNKHAPNFDTLYRHYLKLLHTYNMKSGTQGNGGGGT